MGTDCIEEVLSSVTARNPEHLVQVHGLKSSGLEAHFLFVIRRQVIWRKNKDRNRTVGCFCLLLGGILKQGYVGIVESTSFCLNPVDC